MEIKTMELKKVRHFSAMSEETNCYMGTVYINGKPAIDVKNDGHGGCDMQYPVSGYDHKIIDAANEYCKKNFPAVVFLHGTITADSIKQIQSNITQKDILYCDLEVWCGDQIRIDELKKMAKKLTTKKVSYIDKDGEVYSYNTNQYAANVLIAHVRAKYGDVVILNELSPEKQVELLDKRDQRGQRMIFLTPEEAAKVPEARDVIAEA